jgi:hypothetical protein
MVAAAVAVRRPLGPVGGLSRLCTLIGSCFAVVITTLDADDSPIRRLIPTLA